MSTITIRALPAYAPSPGLVGVVFGKPSLAAEVIETSALADIDAAVDRVEQAAIASGAGYSIIVSCAGRKPRGYDNARPRWRKDGALRGA